MSFGTSVIYVLCLAASAACATLLVRAYLRSGAKLLLYSAACFAMLTLNNLLVATDILLVPGVDLTLFRNLSTLIGISILLYAFIWEID